jgi:hypothetical protein
MSKSAKAPRPIRRIKKNTKGVGLRLKKTTIGWIETQLDEDAPSVPAKVRNWVEEKEAEAKKNSAS